jgi:hypothetical protein
MVPLIRGLAVAGRLHLGQQVVHHVAHVLIIDDRQSRCQVMCGLMLTRMAVFDDRFAS